MSGSTPVYLGTVLFSNTVSHDDVCLCMSHDTVLCHDLVYKVMT